MSLSKVIEKMGQFTGEGGSVPIYGVDTIDLEKGNEWKIINIGILSATTAIWKGDLPVKFAFQFQIVAGIGDIKSRQTLYEKMKLMHSWAAHTRGEKINHPPVVSLNLTGYINCKGSFEVLKTSASGPWEATGGTKFPSTCKFSGTFLMMPGYTPKGVDIVSTATKLGAEQVRASFYQG